MRLALLARLALQRAADMPSRCLLTLCSHLPWYEMNVDSSEAQLEGSHRNQINKGIRLFPERTLPHGQCQSGRWAFGCARDAFAFERRTACRAADWCRTALLLPANNLFVLLLCHIQHADHLSSADSSAVAAAGCPNCTAAGATSMQLLGNLDGTNRDLQRGCGPRDGNQYQNSMCCLARH